MGKKIWLQIGISLLLAMLFLPQAFALEQQITAGNICSADALSQWSIYMAVGMGALLALVAIAYMVGNALSHPQLLDWAKMEFMQAIASVLMFALIVFLITQVECRMSVAEPAKWFGFANAPDVSMMAYAQSYLQNIMEEVHLTIVSIRYEMGILNVRASFNNYVSEGFIGGKGVSISPYSGDYTTNGTMNMLLNLNSTFMLSALFEYFSLFFFASASGLFVLFVPVGLFLRSMPFMRGTGATLIAIGAAFYIFYPLLFAMIGLASNSAGINNYAATQMPSSLGSDAAQKIDSIVQMEQKLANNKRDAYTGGEDSLPKPMLQYEGGKNVDVPKYFLMTSYNFIRAVMLPTIALVITAMFAKDLAALLGEELDASRIAQLV